MRLGPPSARRRALRLLLRRIQRKITEALGMKMMKDNNVLKEMVGAWEGVRKMQAMLDTYATTALVGGFPQLSDYQNACHGLTLIYAYAVLQEVLEQLRDEGQFVSSSGKLGTLMHESKKSLPWVDFAIIDKGRERRNDVAHRRSIVPLAESRRYIDAIEQELIAWKILLGKVRVNYTYERRHH